MAVRAILFKFRRSQVVTLVTLQAYSTVRVAGTVLHQQGGPVVEVHYVPVYTGIIN